MAYLIGDGFDVYASVADITAGGTIWDAGSGGGSLSSVTRFGYGQSIIVESSFGGSQMRKSGLSNEQIVFVNVAHIKQTGGTSGTMYIQLQDTASVPQLTIQFLSASNSITFRRGGTAGTLVATYSSAYVFDSYDHFQIKIKIDTAAGEVHVRKNGATSDSFSSTGLNTQQTANAYCNGVELGTTSIGNFQNFDDFLMFSASGSAPNDWVGDVRAIQLQPTLDTAQKQFTQNAIGVSLSLGDTVNSSTLAYLAGSIRTGEFIRTTQGGTFTTAVVELSAGFTGNAQLGLYIGDGDTQTFNSDLKPGHLIAASNVLVNPVTGVNTFTFPGTVGVMKGYIYFFAFLADTNCTLKGNNGGFTTYLYPNPPSSYAGGLVTDLATLTTGGVTVSMTAYTTLTATNAGLSSDEHEDGTSTYVSDSVVGHFDLYDLCDLFYTPVSIIGISVRAFVAKTDAGGRGYKTSGKSGATSFDTAEYAPLTTFSYSTPTFYNTDPNTGSAWSAAALNALQLGPKISS